MAFVYYKNNFFSQKNWPTVFQKYLQYHFSYMLHALLILLTIAVHMLYQLTKIVSRCLAATTIQCHVKDVLTSAMHCVILKWLPWRQSIWMKI